jgi:diguanylate cyclase (GGDEF)-like protein
MNRRVLVVDDDPAMLKLLSTHLCRAQYEVLTADNGQDALKILHREDVAVVLSDWSMPEMDGSQLCQAIRSSDGIGFVYIIILTAHSDKQRVVEALEAGANDFLSKPFHPQELLARLNAGMRIITLEADLQRQQRELHKANAELSMLNRRLEVMATTDELTELANRREAMYRLKSYWSMSTRHGQPLSCIMLDIDRFKQCNDRFGHDTGDVVLKQAAQAIRSATRAGDLPCRVGGEEFLILCPNATADQAFHAAERLRAAVEAVSIPAGDEIIHVTISAGVAERTEDTTDPSVLFRKADQALYQAKQAGRNRVVVANPQPAPNNCQSCVLPSVY